jgi:hypothetical protein
VLLLLTPQRFDFDALNIFCWFLHGANAFATNLQ